MFPEDSAHFRRQGFVIGGQHLRWKSTDGSRRCYIALGEGAARGARENIH